MTIRVWEDDEAGYALIDLGAKFEDAARLSFRRLEDEPRHLGREGWQPEVGWLEVEPQRGPGATSVVRVGPLVVSRIDEFEKVEIVSRSGPIGVVVWPALARLPIDLVDRPWARREESKVDELEMEIAVEIEVEKGKKDDERSGDEQIPDLPSTPDPPLPPDVPKPKKGALWRVLAFAVLVLAIGAAVVHLARVYDMCGLFGVRVCMWQEARGDTETGGGRPNISERTFRDRLDALTQRQGRDDDFIALGKEALNAGYPMVALAAFEGVANPRLNEEAAWQIARIFDPLVTDAVYATVQNRRPERASPYYDYFKQTSARHRDALRRLCYANTDLVRSNSKFAAECRI